MKLRLLALVASIGCSSPVATTTTATPFNRGACKEIVVQCAYALYYPGGHDRGRDIVVDCVRPLESGAALRDVPLDTATVQGCFGADLRDAEGRRFAEDMAAHTNGVDPR